VWYAVGGVFAALFVLWFLGNYNAFVRLRQHILESWNNIDVELRRRHDLIPNLVEVVKGYAAHERELLEHGFAVNLAPRHVVCFRDGARRGWEDALDGLWELIPPRLRG
jgi:hypothetical protein